MVFCVYFICLMHMVLKVFTVFIVLMVHILLMVFIMVSSVLLMLMVLRMFTVFIVLMVYILLMVFIMMSLVFVMFMVLRMFTVFIVLMVNILLMVFIMMSLVFVMFMVFLIPLWQIETHFNLFIISNCSLFYYFMEHYHRAGHLNLLLVLVDTLNIFEELPKHLRSWRLLIPPGHHQLVGVHLLQSSKGVSCGVN